MNPNNSNIKQVIHVVTPPRAYPFKEQEEREIIPKPVQKELVM